MEFVTSPKTTVLPVMDCQTATVSTICVLWRANSLVIIDLKERDGPWEALTSE